MFNKNTIVDSSNDNSKNFMEKFKKQSKNLLIIDEVHRYSNKSYIIKTIRECRKYSFGVIWINQRLNEIDDDIMSLLSFSTKFLINTNDVTEKLASHLNLDKKYMKLNLDMKLYPSSWLSLDLSRKGRFFEVISIDKEV